MGIRNSVRVRWAVDVALAVSLAAVAAVATARNAGVAPKEVGFPCEIGLGLILVARRRFPLATVVAVTGLSLGEALGGVPMDQSMMPLVAGMVSIYTLSVQATRERATTGFAVAVAGFCAESLAQHKGLGNIVFGLVFVTPVFLAGRGFRIRTEHARLLEREQEEQARAAVEAERRRIARDLHDVISHSLGLVVLQAGAAEQVLDRDPAKARELLTEIRTTGQQTVAEFGTLLALTGATPTNSLEPSPSLDDVDQLAAKLRRTGLAVTVEREGLRRPLPSAVEVSGYRIVQEALTNATRHAGGSQVTVTLRYEPTELGIEVLDDGAGRVAAAPGTQRGLVGMRERAALFGGSVEAAPSESGGWRVAARLPVHR